jgi:hypothetical protein
LRHGRTPRHSEKLDLNKWGDSVGLVILDMGLMMRTARAHHGCWAIVLWTVGVVPGIVFPSIAHAGFFDFLFPPPAVPDTRPFEAGPGYMDFRRRAGHGFHQHKLAARRKLILADKTDHPTQPLAPTDLMDDDSLRHGDAVMTQTGIRIFVGNFGDHHEPEDFRKITEIKNLSPRERNALVGLDAPGSNTIGHKSGEPGMVTGRSAIERKLSVGETISDPSGRLVRYVGP